MSPENVPVSGLSSGNIARYWTLLVLAPDRFYDQKNTSFPMDASSFGRAQTSGYHLGRLTHLVAELHLIGQCSSGFVHLAWCSVEQREERKERYIMTTIRSLVQLGDHRCRVERTNSKIRFSNLPMLLSFERCTRYKHFLLNLLLLLAWRFLNLCNRPSALLRGDFFPPFWLPLDPLL